MDKHTPIEHRVVRLELRVDDHDADLRELKDTSKNLSNSLQGIEKALQQIKWLAIGGALAFFGKDIGIEKVLKIIFGI
jgi:hypothetical protein